MEKWASEIVKSVFNKIFEIKIDNGEDAVQDVIKLRNYIMNKFHPSDIDALNK